MSNTGLATINDIDEKVENFNKIFLIASTSMLR